MKWKEIEIFKNDIFFTLLLLLKNWNKLEGNSKSAMHSSLNVMLPYAWKNIHYEAQLTGKEHKGFDCW